MLAIFPFYGKEKNSHCGKKDSELTKGIKVSV